MDSAAEARGLMAGAMIGLDEEGLSDPPTGQLAIVGLHRLGSREVLEEALAACRDTDPLRRQVGAAVLGQLGHDGIGFTPVFVDERYRALADLLAAERDGAADSDVIAEACFALGHLRDPRATPALAALRGHPDTRVRFAVAFALGGWSTPEAVAALIGLAEDAEETVRDWATFGLAQADTPAIVQPLRARLDDPCLAVRSEAIAGLARRNDDSALAPLIKELRAGPSLPLLEAATALARPELREALLATAAQGLASHLAQAWSGAMGACDGAENTSSEP